MPTTQRLRHPAEIPMFIFMVVLNVIIIWAILQAAITLPFLPDRIRESGWGTTIRSAFIALLLLVPALVVIRETQRASIRGGAVELSPRQYPDLYAIVDEFAAKLALPRRPSIYLANGNGTLNAFAAQATGHDYVVIANELFVNLRHENRAGLRFILGHEVGHIKLHHVALWYQLAVAYSERIPILGPTLSRLREYSCDRHGAHLCPDGATGLVLLAGGRYTENTVDIPELVRQGKRLHGFWVGLAQLPMSHPFTVRRLERLVSLGMLRSSATDDVRSVHRVTG
ncbi:M48 family metallopeptidase [Actinoplanes sp. NPDC048796]|uniref:M48 family metallopeptidase n=1 Tax=unclassified Actinoplanes TaxID=2626549 RepID=UPI0034047C7B